MNVLDEKRSSPELRGYVKERIRKMQDVMARKGVDVTILMRPENVFYFSNFNPILISHVPYFILTRDDAFLLVHCIRHDHAVNEGAVDKVLCYGKWGATQAVAMDAMDAMRELLGGGPLTVGVEGDYASMNFLDRLKTKLQVKGYVDIAQDAVDLRLIKDPHEIKMCRISGELVDLGVTRAIEALEGGASEAQAATEGQYAMRNRWHEKYQQYEVSGFSNSETADIDTFVVWCMSNERLNYGCDCPTGYVPMPGDLTMPMSWARIAGYNVENERTVIVGHVNEERTRAYDAMLRARDNIFRMLRPGAIFEDLYFAAMKDPPSAVQKMKNLSAALKSLLMPATVRGGSLPNGCLNRWVRISRAADSLNLTEGSRIISPIPKMPMQCAAYAMPLRKRVRISALFSTPMLTERARSSLPTAALLRLTETG